MAIRTLNATICVVAALTFNGCTSLPDPASASAKTVEAPARWSELATAINQTMRRWHYNPRELDTAAYRAIEARVDALSRSAESRDDFVRDFNAAWRDGPFSHVRLEVARATAAETAAYLDSMRVGGTGAQLTWRDDVAILTVNTMMGADTVEQINAAYDAIVQRPARALVIDLRANEGGAFAGIPLVGHLLAEPLDTGAFVSQVWARSMDRAPVRADVESAAPWNGSSLTEFWRDAQDNRITRIQFRPMAPHFAGPVYVLTGPKTASAAEMTADALKASGRATLIGEPTAGQMLSQKMYDLPEGLQLSLPIADYHAFLSGRIEGAGVKPDVETPAAGALDLSLSKIMAN